MSDMFDFTGEDDTPTCEITGCANTGTWRITSGTAIKTVCYKCRDEIMSLWGWRLV